MSATAATASTRSLSGSSPWPSIPALVAQGLRRNTAGYVAATKRDGQWRELPLTDFLVQVRRAAMALRRLGVKRGDRVALHAEPSAEWIVVDQAALSLGAVTVPIYPTQPGDQVAWILENAGAGVYVTSSPKIWKTAGEHVKGVAGVKHLVGIRGALDGRMVAWDDFLAMGTSDDEEANAALLERERDATRPTDLATLIYTSGTTGMPKGVMLSHANLTSNALSVLPRLPWNLEGERPDGRVLSYLPLSHVFERMLMYVYLHIGYPIHFMEVPDEIQADLATVRPVHFSTVPRLLEKVYSGIHARANEMTGLQQKIFKWAIDLADRYDVMRAPTLGESLQRRAADVLVYRKLRARLGGRLRAITAGGAALSGKVMNFFNGVGIFCGQGYGMTETSPVIAVYDPKRLRAGSIGTPIDGVEVKLAEDGELLVRGPNVMQGYWNNTEQTRETIDTDGWLHTGDIAERDADGFLYITDRKKDLLKLSTGKYVAPQPIETRLAQCALIEQCVVIGNALQFCSVLIVPSAVEVKRRLAVGDVDLATSEQVRAAIQQEIDEMNRTLPPWEQVKKFTLLNTPWTIEGGELTPTLKVKRRVIHERFKAVIEKMYAV